MIKLASFRPEFFNNNGDQGNLEVLEKQLSWRGIPVTITEELDGADLVLFGDASRAAMREFASELEGQLALLKGRLENNLPTLLIGSCHEFFAPKLGLTQLRKVTRASEFRELEADGVHAFGYRNSEVDVDLEIRGFFVSTTLFGPVLAKSPELLERILEGLGVRTPLDSEKSQSLDEMVREIRRRAIAD